MPTYYHDVVQGTDEWHDLRAGKWSASKAAVIMGGLDTSGLAEYIKDLAWGRVYGKVDPKGYKSAAMERGSELEPDTRSKYRLTTDRVIVECGLVVHSDLPNVCWSPDGLEPPNFRHAIEGKAPLHRAYMEVVRTQKIPAEYRWQTKFGMWVGELESMDFLCDHPSAGLIIIPCEVTDGEKQAMRERIELLEHKVAKWVEILSEQKAA